jgi:hypothetical protein
MKITLPLLFPASSRQPCFQSQPGAHMINLVGLDKKD